MLEWIAEKLLSAFNTVPALLVAENSPTFDLVRAIYGLLILAIVLYVIVMLRPVRSLIGQVRRKGSDVGSSNHSG
jgi:ABC-type transport system involved in cytochrome c biogenesis permease subunit